MALEYAEPRDEVLHWNARIRLNQNVNSLVSLFGLPLRKRANRKRFFGSSKSLLKTAHSTQLFVGTRWQSV